MAKYIVSVGTVIGDRDGNREGEEFRYTFDELPLIESRNKAIEKVKSLQSFFFDEMPESNKFISFGEGLLSESVEYNSVTLALLTAISDLENSDTSSLKEKVTEKSLLITPEAVELTVASGAIISSPKFMAN